MNFTELRTQDPVIQVPVERDRASVTWWCLMSPKAPPPSAKAHVHKNRYDLPGAQELDWHLYFWRLERAKYCYNDGICSLDLV